MITGIQVSSAFLMGNIVIDGLLKVGSDSLT